MPASRKRFRTYHSENSFFPSITFFAGRADLPVSREKNRPGTEPPIPHCPGTGRLIGDIREAFRKCIQTRLKPACNKFPLLFERVFVYPIDEVKNDGSGKQTVGGSPDPIAATPGPDLGGETEGKGVPAAGAGGGRAGNPGPGDPMVPDEEKADHFDLRHQVRSEAIHRVRPQHPSHRGLAHPAAGGRAEDDSPVQNRRGGSGDRRGIHRIDAKKGGVPKSGTPFSGMARTGFSPTYVFRRTASRSACFKTNPTSSSPRERPDTLHRARPSRRGSRFVAAPPLPRPL